MDLCLFVETLVQHLSILCQDNLESNVLSDRRFGKCNDLCGLSNTSIARKSIELVEDSRRRTTFPFLSIIPPILTALLTRKDIIRYTHLIHIVFVRLGRPFQSSRSVRTVEGLGRLDQIGEAGGMERGFSRIGRSRGRLFRCD